MAASSKLQEGSRVAVVGAGLAGLALAVFLAEARVKVDIYETRAEQAGLLGGGLSLAPNALRIIDRLGLLEKVEASGYVYESLHFVREDASVIGIVPHGSDELYGYPACRIRRSDLHAHLIERVKALPLVKIHWSKGVKGLTQTENSVTVTFADGSSSEPADILVAADGIHSRVRHLIYPDLPENTYEGVVSIGGRTTMDRISSYKVPALIFGQSGTTGLFPLAKDDTSWFATLEIAEDKGREGWAKWAADGEAVAQARKQLKDWRGPFPGLLAEATPDRTFIWPQYSVPPMSSWVKGRTVVVGDAAHAIPPSGGQGSAMAFEDVELLARCLTQGISLDKWETERRRRVAIITAATKDSGRTRKVGQRASWIGYQVKTLIMAAYFNLPLGIEQRGRGIFGYDSEKEFKA